MGTWDPVKAKGMDEKLFAFGPWKYTQQDFVTYLDSKQFQQPVRDIPPYVNAMYESYVKERILAYEESQLEQKYPSFRTLMREYHDGILLFELTDRKVWSKAAADTVGLKAFYEKHTDNYQWEESIVGTIYSTPHEKTAGRVHELLTSARERSLDDQWVIREIEAIRLNAEAQSGRFEKSRMEVLRHIPWKQGVSDVVELNSHYYIVNIQEVMAAQPKQINEIRGTLIADYQNHLERLWVKELRKKYDIVVNRKLLKSIKF